MIVAESLATRLSNSITLHKDVTFAHARAERIHRWFPYLEGFGENFIRDVLAGTCETPQIIYEPFAGSGTLPVYCQLEGIDIFYNEVNPFLQQLIILKLDLLQQNEEQRSKLIAEIEEAQSLIKGSLTQYPRSTSLEKAYKDVFEQSVYFEPSNFDYVLRMRSLIDEIPSNYLKETLEMAACEALLHASLLKRAGDIRYKRGKELNQIVKFDDRVIENLNRIKADIAQFEDPKNTVNRFFSANAKELNKDFIGKVDMVLTSPPYLNGTNYIRNAKLELWFLRYLTVKADLAHFRKLVVTSGINDVTSEKKDITLTRLNELLTEPGLWYDRRIPKMIKDYFYDMQRVFDHMFLYLKQGGLVCIDIGDSIYGGVHIPTDELLIQLLQQSGFTLIDNIKLRSRKSKSGTMVKQTLIVVQK